MSYLRLDDYTVPGHDLLITSSFDFKKEDASGDSSSTTKASKGTKGKKLSVKLFIKYDESDFLRDLVQVAEAKDGADGKIYTITNNTANAMGVRQVTFTEKFQVAEQKAQRQWQISFSLTEANSVPEMAEARLEDPEEATQANPGQSVEPEKELSWFEKILVAADEAIGPEAEE